MKRYRDIAGDGGSNVVGQVGAQLARLRRRLEPIRFIVAVVSGKGGVGKSTMTADLACALRPRRLAGRRPRRRSQRSLHGQDPRRARRPLVAADEVEPPRALGIRVMSMDLLLPSDASPLVWDAPTQAEAHTWRGTMEANALREFLADTAWGALDVLLVDLPPGTDRLATVVSLVPGLAGTVLVTIPSDLSQLIVKKSITVARRAACRCWASSRTWRGSSRAGRRGARAGGGHSVPRRGAVRPELALAADRGEPFVPIASERAAARALRIAAVSRSGIESRPPPIPPSRTAEVKPDRARPLTEWSIRRGARSIGGVRARGDSGLEEQAEP